MIGLLLLLAQAAAPLGGPAQTASLPVKDVIITGRRISDTEAALKACLDRHCPVDQDVDATLAHAENQFIAGDYDAARRTVLASIGRNKREGRRYPVPVSDLWRANSRIAIHLGEADAFRYGAIASLDALKAGLAKDDARVLAQRVEVGDSLAHLGRTDEAFSIYSHVARQAGSLGLPKIRGFALLRTAMLYTVLAESRGGIFDGDARHAIADLTENPAPEFAEFREAGHMLAARQAARTGNDKPLDDFLASYRGRRTTAPVLIYAPAIKSSDNERAFQSSDVLAKMPAGTFDGQWADVGFWIRADGTVDDVGLLRGSPTLDRHWLPPVLKAIGARLYAPLALDATSPGLLRVERYTLTAHLIEMAGSHIRTREAFPRIEMMDLSTEPPAKTAG